MKTYRISTPCLQQTPHLLYSTMHQSVLALLSLYITYVYCDSSITPLLEFTPLHNAHNTFASIQHLSHMTSSFLPSPFHCSPETIALNQTFMTQHSFIGPMTQYSFIGPATQYSFIGPGTQNNFIGPMTQIPSNIKTFVYLSQYSLATLQCALLQIFFGFKYECIQFPIKRVLLILDQFVFNSNFSEQMLHLFSYKSAQFLLKLQKRLTLCHNWNINHKTKIFMLNSLQVNVKLLIARILMKLSRYITRRHNFAHYWKSLPFHDLLLLHHIFFWVLIGWIGPMSICPINFTIFLINQVTFLMNSFTFLHTCFIKLFIYLNMIIQNFFTLLWWLCISISKKKKKNCLLASHAFFQMGSFYGFLYAKNVHIQCF